jgi:hypothetical protein
MTGIAASKGMCNHLLAAMPKADYDLLLPRLELVELPLGKILYESGHSIVNVYFPTTAIVSLLYVLVFSLLQKA